MGKAQNISQRYKASIPHKLGISKHILTARVGLIVVAQLMHRLGLTQLVDQQLPAPGSNRGYRQGGTVPLKVLKTQGDIWYSRSRAQPDLN